MSKLLNELWTVFLRWLALHLLPYVPPPRPFPPSAALVREEKSMLVYAVTLPPATAPDVVSYELTQVIDGGAPVVLAVKLGDPKPEIKVADGAKVSLTVIEVDDAGNKSPASPAFEFTAADTIAPGAPDAPSVELVREEA